jgi:hypothetical protein
VIEGNRRVLALKALDTPSLVSAAYTPAQNKRLMGLADKYAAKPIESITCTMFDNEEEARHWIELRHTGQNLGRGLVEWAPSEQDRFKARHPGHTRSTANQVVDFVRKHGTLSPEAMNSTQPVTTNIERLLTTPEARRGLGVDVVNGEVVALHPTEEVAKALSRVVEDLRTKKVTVPDLYTADHRKSYVATLPKAVLPKKASMLATPARLDDLTAGSAPRPVKPRPTRRRRPTPPPRTTVVPRDSNLSVTVPRINQIYTELSTLPAEQYPNSCSVLLRVFIELSVDHHLSNKNVMSDSDIAKYDLAKRLRAVADALHKGGKINAKLKAAVERVGNSGPSVLAPNMRAFNQYVHNEYVFPRPPELYAAWDELYPMLEKVWP